MKRRWLGVLVMVWVSLISLFSSAPGVHAANETYKFDAAGDIVGSGDYNATFVASPGNTYVSTQNLGIPGNPCTIVYTIDSVKKTSATTSSGHISTITNPAPPACQAHTP